MITHVFIYEIMITHDTYLHMKGNVSLKEP